MKYTIEQAQKDIEKVKVSDRIDLIDDRSGIYLETMDGLNETCESMDKCITKEEAEAEGNEDYGRRFTDYPYYITFDGDGWPIGIESAEDLVQEIRAIYE